MCVFLAVAARQALVGTIVVGGCAYTRDELEKLKIPALKNLLHQAKLPTTAPKKAGLIDRLWNNLKVEMPAPVVELQAEGERVPAQEEQVPTMPTDGEQMVAQGGAVPIEEEQFPVEGEQVPEGEQQGSAEGDQLPAEGEQVLARGEQVTVEGEQMPTEGEQVQEEEQQSAEGEQGSADGSAEGVQVPAEEGEQVPSGGEQAEEVQGEGMQVGRMLVWGHKRERTRRDISDMQQGETQKRVKHNPMTHPHGEARTVDRPQSEDTCLRRSKRARAPNTRWE